jgi:hypothetical protein
MKKYIISLIINLAAAGSMELYFGTVFNESVRHVFDLPAMLYVVPGLLLNRFFHLGLTFDGPNHSGVIWLSALVYIAITIVLIVIVGRVINSPKSAN